MAEIISSDLTPECPDKVDSTEVTWIDIAHQAYVKAKIEKARINPSDLISFDLDDTENEADTISDLEPDQTIELD